MYSDGKEFNVRELVEGKISRVKFVLTNMGLNDYQASALSHLIYLGETKATTLSKASGVPNARIYGILDELAKKGLLKIRPGRPMLYSPVTPNEIASALISEARDELRKRLKIVELNSDDFLKIANDIYLKAGIVNERTPLLRIVSVGDVSMNETQNLYKNAKKNLLIMTRAMEYYDDVAQQLRDVIKKKSSLNVFTAGATAVGNYGLAYVFFTLDLWLSVSSSFLIATLWLLLFIFSMRNKKGKNNKVK